MTSLKLPTLLAITESPLIRYWITKYLKDQFYIIDAHTEKKTLETIENSRLDFVVLDATFEECEALELCKKIRRLDPHRSFPILLITGRLKKSYRDAALDSGVTDFLSDQLDSEELETRIAIAKKATQVRQTVSELSSDYFKNRVLLHKQAILFLDTAKKKNTAVTMLVAQIDDFAEIQSKYGLTTADEILVSISDLLNKNIRQEHAVTPSTDGQFIALLTGANAAESEKIAELVQLKIKDHPFKTKQGPAKITASFAISKIETTESSFNKTINTASAALKQSTAKKNIIFSLNQGLPD